jgi:hypothetical protein
MCVKFGGIRLGGFLGVKFEDFGIQFCAISMLNLELLMCVKFEDFCELNLTILGYDLDGFLSVKFRASYGFAPFLCVKWRFLDMIGVFRSVIL